VKFEWAARAAKKIAHPRQRVIAVVCRIYRREGRQGLQNPYMKHGFPARGYTALQTTKRAPCRAEASHTHTHGEKISLLRTGVRPCRSHMIVAQVVQGRLNFDIIYPAAVGDADMES
jgi:hypothetical protein